MAICEVVHEVYGEFAGRVGQKGDYGWVEWTEVCLSRGERLELSDKVEGVVGLAQGVGFEGGPSVAIL